MSLRRATAVAILGILAAAASRAQTPAAGPEFVANSVTTGEQDYGACAIAPNGDFVVTWASYQGAPPPPVTDVAGQRFDISGAKQGSEFTPNSFTTDSQYDSHVAMDAAGSFVVVWTSVGQETGAYPATGVYGQRFSATGVPLGAEFHVNTETYDYQDTPAVARRPAGDFVVVWESYGQDGSDYGVFGQRYGAAGAPAGSEFVVNSHTTGAQAYPAVAMDSSGNFVVAWESKDQDGSNYGIFAQRFNAAGVAQGPEFQVNTYTTGSQDSPQVAMDSSGRFVVVWSSFGQLGLSTSHVFGRRYDAAGAAQGGEFLVGTYTTGGQNHPNVAMDGAGNFVVVWHGGANAIFGQRFDAQGRRDGGGFPVTGNTSAGQNDPDVALNANGNIIVSWQRNGGDGSGLGVIGRRLERDAAGVMKVDEPSSAVVHSPAGVAANRVLEPGETVTVAPAWKNTLGSATAITGTASAFAGPAGGAYTINDSSADYGSLAAGASADCATATGDCYQMTVTGSPRPAAHWDATFLETLSNNMTKTWTLHVGESFTDVPTSQLFYRAIESVLHAGITTGCTGTTYCPADQVTRSQMSLFLARGVAGGGPAIPTTGVLGAQAYNCAPGGVSLFTDVLPTDIFCKSVHYLASQNVTSGCSATQYCPTPNVTRIEMSAFVARAVVAPGGGAAVPLTYGPDPVTGLSYSCNPAGPNTHFDDVPASNSFCKHAHFLWAKGIISGCGATTYCPNDPVTRDAMARFLTNGFNVQLYGP